MENGKWKIKRLLTGGMGMGLNEDCSEVYVYIWEFRAKTGSELAFETAYGPGGDWVSLFSRANGYIKTELYRDLEAAGRYITADFWNSQAAFQDFHAEFVTEFAELDARSEELTETEMFMGSFMCMGP